MEPGISQVSSQIHGKCLKFLLDSSTTPPDCCLMMTGSFDILYFHHNCMIEMSRHRSFVEGYGRVWMKFLFPKTAQSPKDHRGYIARKLLTKGPPFLISPVRQNGFSCYLLTSLLVCFSYLSYLGVPRCSLVILLLIPSFPELQIEDVPNDRDSRFEPVDVPLAHGPAHLL